MHFMGLRVTVGYGDRVTVTVHFMPPQCLFRFHSPADTRPVRPVIVGRGHAHTALLT